MSTKTKNSIQKIDIESQKDIDAHIEVLCDLIIDVFIANWQQTKGNKTRHTKEELKHTFRDSNGRLSKSERA